QGRSVNSPTLCIAFCAVLNYCLFLVADFQHMRKIHIEIVFLSTYSFMTVLVSSLPVIYVIVISKYYALILGIY
ncbi:hypothetical protein ALC57_11962, partial [Trachymyrmex cornetzi]